MYPVEICELVGDSSPAGTGVRRQ